MLKDHRMPTSFLAKPLDAKDIQFYVHSKNISKI